jgi:hypothetical protein
LKTGEEEYSKHTRKQPHQEGKEEEEKNNTKN